MLCMGMLFTGSGTFRPDHSVINYSAAVSAVVSSAVVSAVSAAVVLSAAAVSLAVVSSSGTIFALSQIKFCT